MLNLRPNLMVMTIHLLNVFEVFMMSYEFIRFLAITDLFCMFEYFMLVYAVY